MLTTALLTLVVTAVLAAAASSRHLARVGREAGLVVPLVAHRGARRRHLVALAAPAPGEHPQARAA